MAATHAFALVVIINALLSVSAHGETPGVPALVVKAKRDCFPPITRFTGLVVARKEKIINQYEIDGYQISEVFKHEGDAVSPNDVLAKLDRLAAASPTATSATMPGGAAAIPPATRPLRAEVFGIITQSSAKIGQVAAAMPSQRRPEPLFRITVGNQIEIEAEVPSLYLPKVAVGQRADVHLDNGEEITSQVRAILPLVDPATQLGKVRLTVSNPAIRIGMFARGTIGASSFSTRYCGVSVPLTALSPDGKTLQIVRDNVVHTQVVQTGLRKDPDIEVRGDIREGDLVIANAGASLRDGDRISPKLVDASRPN